MINLQPFCATNPDRAYLMQPWSRGEFSYATNGHILVRVPRQDGVSENPKAPPVEKVWVFGDGTEVFPLPALTIPEIPPTPCNHCDGAGAAHRCAECDEEWDDGCSDCDGSGQVDNELMTSCEIDGFRLSVKYLRMIAALPGAMLGRPTAGEDRPVRFTFDGGEGRVMGLRGRHTNHIQVIDGQPPEPDPLVKTYMERDGMTEAEATEIAAAARGVLAGQGKGCP